MTSKFILLLGAGMLWLSNPPELFAKLVTVFGLEPDGSAAQFIIGCFVAIILLVIAWLADHLSDIIDRFTQRNYPTGIWLYSYAPKPNDEFDDERPTVGIFSIRKRNGRYSISDGESFQIRDDGLFKRGEWSARNVTRNENSIEFVYDFISHHRYLDEENPKFRGHIFLSCKDKSGLLGSVQSGMLNDLDERSHVWGPIHAEKVGIFLWSRNATLRKLQSNFKELFAQLD